jgi:nucleoside 2-deoxyribosyltransferase
MKIFVICPVRNATESQKQDITEWIEEVKKDGHEVYYPAIHTNQNDSRGLRICKDNRKAIEDADMLAIYYVEDSTGSLFDLGMAFSLRKPLITINIVPETEKKSFKNVIKDWEAWGCE